jgi:phosphoribosylaminoimidazole-succinocarboxamide synthase
LPGWRHVYSGKVRDVYEPEEPDGTILIVASDRVSAFDHILDTEIPDKGAILTAMSLWWLSILGAGTSALPAVDVPHHVLSTDVPAPVAGRAMICRALDMVPVEAVARGYLTGSGLADYAETGSVCGVQLPAGLVHGSRLPEPIFTPATKAPLGDHDANVSYAAVVERTGAEVARLIRQLTVQIYSFAAQVAADRRIILADTKLEFGHDPHTGRLTLGDELLTPDSSRFWPAEEWRPGRCTPSFDKQIVRDWLTSAASGWDRRGDEPPPPLPESIIERVRARYLEAYHRLTGHRWDPGSVGR